MITNTFTEAEENPLAALFFATPSGIRAQERRGQQEACATAVLPTEGLDAYRPGGLYAALGIQILDVVENDPIFTNVKLPEGWSIKPTDHSLYNDIVDTQGQRRAGYFYKAAFYDRSAHMRDANSRYSIQPVCDDDPAMYSYLVIDLKFATWKSDGSVCAEAIIHTVHTPVPAGMRRYSVSKQAKEAAYAWIKEHYPNNDDVTAYWD